MPHGGTATTKLSQWFHDEVHPHDAQLKSYLRGSFPSVREVDDLVQESYLRVWKARAAQPIGSARSFLFQVARRLAIDVLRRRKTSRIDAVCDLAALPVIEDRPSAADAACRSEELWLLAQAIHALPARCREVMILRKIEGLSQKQIAVRLGITEGTVQIHVGRGLRHLEDFFFNLDPGHK
ncbi:MAG: RNA polymerase sigma factor [Opitutaceae bacterium]